MKTRMIQLTLVLAFIFCCTGLSAQVVVEKKPVPPALKLHNPPKPGPEYVLIPGHWIWARKQKMYLWVVSTWVPKREGYKWVPGYWKELPKGWKWVPGYWEKTDRRRYFFN